MKTCLLGIILFLGPALSAGPIESVIEGRERVNPTRTKLEKMLPSKKQKMLVITEAKLVPLIEFLGLPNVNDLPPTSAGETETRNEQID